MQGWLRLVVIAAGGVFVALPVAAKKQPFWIETVSVIAVGQGICGVPLQGDGMQMAIGSAMITHALTKAEVIERARKRSHFIARDIEKRKFQNTFCSAFPYYLEKGYPR